MLTFQQIPVLHILSEARHTSSVGKKAVQDFSGTITLYSNNSKYPPKILNEGDNAIIVGKVVWNGSKGNI